MVAELHHENRVYIDGDLDVPVAHQRRTQEHQLAGILVKQSGLIAFKQNLPSVSGGYFGIGGFYGPHHHDGFPEFFVVSE